MKDSRSHVNDYKMKSRSKEKDTKSKMSARSWTDVEVGGERED